MSTIRPAQWLVTPEHVVEQQTTLLRTVAQRMLEGPMRLLQQQEALLSIIKHPTFQGEDLEAVFALLTETAARLMNLSRVGVWCYNEARDAISCRDLYELAATRHSSGITLSAAVFPRYFAALASSEAICADDARTDLRTSEFTEGYLDPPGITSMMDIPLIVNGQLEGVICHEHVGTRLTWMPEDRLFGMAIANLAVLAMERFERVRAVRQLTASEQQRRSEIEERLRQSEARYRTLVDDLRVVVFQANAEGDWTFLNPAWTDLTGYPVEHGLGSGLLNAVHEHDRPACERFFRAPAHERRDCRVELRLLTSTGDVRWVEGFASPIVGPGGVVVGSSGTLTDITDRKAAEARIERLAYHDALTGLPNRTLLLDRLDRALVDAKRNHKRMAVLFLDLDHFKTINDTLGHAVGDSLLADVGDRLKGLLREEDTVGRFGGDEFLVVLPGFQVPADARAVCAKALALLAQPFLAGGHTVEVSASIGVSVYPDDAQHRETLLQCADTALYRAKSTGHGTYQFFTPDEPEGR
jgi:diguanylate cyclase (GGDEF)-like protein/PAS domain S-box-containing protein